MDARLFALAVALLELLCLPVSIRAAEPQIVFSETRRYDIFVDNKPSGQSTLTIARYDDGSESVRAEAKVSVTWVVFTYVYEFSGTEVWRQGKLDQLDSRAIDGGRKLSLSVKRAERGYNITKSDGRALAGPDVQLTTNYWRKPSGQAGDRLTLLDADNGKIYDDKIAKLGQEELTIAGQKLSCSTYHLQGSLNVQLWFDDAGYLVRQLGIEDGHPTEVRLASVQQAVRAGKKGLR